jgi:hypothetical protein
LEEKWLTEPSWFTAEFCFLGWNAVYFAEPIDASEAHVASVFMTEEPIKEQCKAGSKQQLIFGLT